MNPSQGLRKMRGPDDDTREALDELPYGVYVIGSSDGQTPNAMIADWVMQVSFEPRMVAVAFEDDSHSLSRIRNNLAFTINLLTEEPDSLELARHFLQPYNASKIKGRSEGDLASHVFRLPRSFPLPLGRTIHVLLLEPTLWSR